MHLENPSLLHSDGNTCKFTWLNAKLLNKSPNLNESEMIVTIVFVLHIPCLVFVLSLKIGNRYRLELFFFLKVHGIPYILIYSSLFIEQTIVEQILSQKIIAHVCVCVCVHICMYMCMYACMYACMHIYIHSYMSDAHIHIHKHAYIHTYTHLYLHFTSPLVHLLIFLHCRRRWQRLLNARDFFSDDVVNVFWARKG